MEILSAIVFLIIGYILLIKGAEFLVDSSSNIAKKFHIPQIVIGLTIVSIGTSLPELCISVTSAINKYDDMSIGNVLGSCLCNLLLILGLSATIRPLKFKRETRIFEIPMCLIFTVIFAICCNTNGSISRIDAILLLVLFIIFILYTIFMGLKGERFDEENISSEDVKKISILKSIVFIVLGIIALKFGGDLVVDNAIIIAKHLNMSEQIISLTIVAIGTSLPELVTSVVAAIKGNSDISIGNILGSNIFNMTLVVGVSSLINPMVFNLEYNVEIGVLISVNIVLALFPLLPLKNKMSRSNGIIYLLLYLLYAVFLFKI